MDRSLSDKYFPENVSGGFVSQTWCRRTLHEEGIFYVTVTGRSIHYAC
jgi:hypothetical protein